MSAANETAGQPFHMLGRQVEGGSYGSAPSGAMHDGHSVTRALGRDGRAFAMLDGVSVHRHSIRIVLAFIGFIIVPSLASADGTQSDAALAKQLANPIANLISVPLQFNYDSGYGAAEGDKTFVNIQPVVPTSISEEWNLISRTVVPIIGQNDIAGDSGAQFGLGDTVQSIFLSPKTSAHGVVWGVGPVFLLPTATDDLLGGEQWGAGPTGVVLKQAGPWTVGGLANHIWSFAGDAGREDVNATFLQPFASYTYPTALSIFLSSESTYNWETKKWSVPINAGVNQLLDIGGQKVQLGFGVRYWAESTSSGPDGFGLRVNVTFLFPK